MTSVIKQGGIVPVCKCELKHITKSAVSGQRAFILSLYSYPFISIHVHLLSSRHIHFDDIINVVPKSSIHFPFLSASVPASSHLRFSSLLRGVFFSFFNLDARWTPWCFSHLENHLSGGMLLKKKRKEIRFVFPSYLWGLASLFHFNANFYFIPIIIIFSSVFPFFFSLFCTEWSTVLLYLYL